MIRQNGKYDVDIKCLWCKYEFILIAHEVWYNAYYCPECKKPIGLPKYSYGQKRASFDEFRSGLVPYARADFYIFRVIMNKGKVMPFMTKFMKDECGYIKGIYTDSLISRSKWNIQVEARGIFSMEGVEWENPILLMSQ